MAANTQEKYIALLRKSEIFKNLTLEEQHSIINAEGTERDGYENIFKEAEEILVQAQGEFMEKNKNIVKDFTLKVKSIRKKKLLIDEKQSANIDKENENILLQKLAQL